MPATYSQQNRQLQVTTPLGEDALLLIGFEGAEQFNKLFTYKLRMLSTNSSIAAKDIVGKNVTFSVTLRDKTPRYFNGYVSRFVYKGQDDRFSLYLAEVVPWTWFLTQTKDCRIFQAKTVPQIIKEVFRDFSIAKVDDSAITGTHEPWEYCVQYRESDFDFVSRLMEQEGIYSYFKHENGVHTLILGDSARGYKIADEKSATLKASFSSGASSDNLLDWERVYEFRPAKYAHADYNFETPSANMVAQAAGTSKVPGTDQFEVFEYPGDYETKSQGEADARIRMEEIAAGTDVVHGRSVNASWSPGYKFTVDQHHVADEEGNIYVLCSTAHEAKLTGEYTSTDTAELSYSNTFTAISAAKPFRPERVTPKPFVHGPQTALVVGAPGDLIPVDKYGRVKVSFFWDRRSKKDDTSSCWMRVSQTSGGAGWGGMFHPHAGHEVIVSFIEGDPDRPIITGRVYNAERDHPMDAVAKKSRSGMRDHGGNHIVMEGAAGQQIMGFHCPTHSTSIVLGNSIDIQSESDFVGHFAQNDSFIFGGTSLKKVGKGFSLETGTTAVPPIPANTDPNSNPAEAAKPPGEVEDGMSVKVHDANMDVTVDKGDFKLVVTTGNMEIDVKGYKEETIHGNFKKMHAGEVNIEHMAGLEHKTILGLATEFIGGGEVSIMAGIGRAEIVAAGISYELTKTHHIHHCFNEVHLQSKTSDVHVIAHGKVVIDGEHDSVDVKSPHVHIDGEKFAGLRSDEQVTMIGKDVVVLGRTELKLTGATVKLNGKIDINDGAVTVEGSVVSASDFEITDDRMATAADYANLLNS